MSQHDPLESLNPEQRAAVEHGVAERGGATASPLLVIAGAGSGKTNTLAHRVAHLIANGADPRRTLLLTFSRRAAAEMMSRVERILAQALGANHPAARAGISWAGTFHGIGARLLRQHAGSIGLSPGFTILDREDAADLVDLVRHELGFSGRDTRFPRKATCLAIYSRAVNARAPLEAVLSKAFPWCTEWEAELKRLFAGYVEAKQRQGVLDYDDLLLYWAQMMQLPAIAAEVAERFDHVLVDEYQDTNRLQASILLGLKPDGRGLTVVGDDAQSIYGFRAATVRNILEFPDAFTPPARVVTLERNYRSTQPILAASNAVIAASAERFAKALHSERPSAQRPWLVTVQDETSQVRYVVTRILENREAGIALKRQAVLFRTAHHSSALELELARRNIPFVKFGGLKFLEAAHVKDLLAILRWSENPKDQTAGFRVLQLLPGVGPATARKLLDLAAGAFLPADALAGSRPPAAAAADWPGFVELFGDLHRHALGWPDEIARARDWLAPHLDRIYEDAGVRIGDLEQLEAIAAGYRNRSQFLTELTLDPPDATSDEAGTPLLDEDYLILSTIHSAKGQEWTAVYILNVVDGCIPSDMATGSEAEIEEERRLLYVAMTRAKDDLHIVLPQRFFTHHQQRSGDRHVYAARSRFIPAGMLGLFDSRSWVATRPAKDAASKTSAEAKVDLAADIRAMWQ
ncbi:MAG: ATP-dependent helicase UvrD/PcrA [Rhodospirillaceae bacterium]|nr:ATP-dependent helicase UvrD/PcrA [Rhodospirillaceae bacterium]